jgi:hypothetical protein
MLHSNTRQYDKDFYAWITHNAALIRQGKFSEIDAEHVAEELEDMGKSNKRELLSRLSVLIAHLLKWQFQSKKHSRSWKYTIKEQRFEILDLLKESPSLKYELRDHLTKTYKKAILIAAREMKISEEKLPLSCPFNLQECLDHEFWPKPSAAA